MPFGFERLNERQQRPNQNIVFIKPLEGADKAIAQDFLERIAAQCAPVMKANYLYVVALEVGLLPGPESNRSDNDIGVSTKQGVLRKKLQRRRDHPARAQISQWTLATFSLRADGDDA